MRHSNHPAKSKNASPKHHHTEQQFAFAFVGPVLSWNTPITWNAWFLTFSHTRPNWQVDLWCRERSWKTVLCISDRSRIVLEWVAILAFAMAWLIKGHAILTNNDEKLLALMKLNTLIGLF